ncbi:MAG: SAM-dependent methyltransferase [Actinomycetales bacterium]|nr:MAG: SAM-dependent methyltransferase [Actinomycetales bacterium]
MDPALVLRLASHEGRALLESLPPDADRRALTVATSLRAAGHDPQLVAAALHQAELRARARAKFGEQATRMLFTADGLEQATRPELAARHAGRFVEAGVRTVHDLGCGIGSDARAFASAGLRVLAYDRDPATAAVATANLAQWPDALVSVRDTTDLGLEGTGSPAGQRHTGVWFDPARRRADRTVEGRARRTWSLDDLSPSWAHVCAVAAGVPATGAKLAPGMPYAAVPAGCEAQWTSWRGEVLECVVWWGPLVRAPGRTAAVCRPGPDGVETSLLTKVDVVPDLPPAVPGIAELGTWLWEADRAVVRAGLTGALPGRQLTPGSGLSTADAGPDLPWARKWRVVEALPLRPKRIRAWLRSRDIGRVTVKKRHASIDPERLRRELATGRDGAITLIVTTIGDTGAAIAVTPAD